MSRETDCSERALENFCGSCSRAGCSHGHHRAPNRPEMLNRSQNAFAMPSQDRPGLNKRTLHRQPRLSPPGRQRESRLATQSTDDAEITRSEKTARHSDIPRALVDVHHDVRKRTVIAPSEDARVATRLATPPLAPHRFGDWEPTALTARGRQSLEWETETLLDPNGTGPDGMASYPCPYRKRNPARFNIRDHEDCARSPFDSIRALKQHIIHYHQRKPALRQCRRCKERFGAEAELEEHLLLPKDRICDVKEPCLDDYEDGITEKTASILAATDGDDARSWTWQTIWCLLFPGDPEIPDAAHLCSNKASFFAEFHPVAELAEVEQAFDEGQGSLREELREKLELLLPEPVDPSYLGFLTGQLELVFETHRIDVIKRTLARCRPNVLISGEELSRTQTQPAEQPSVPKKPSRRSRRSTVLQALQRSTHAPYRRDSSAGGTTTRNINNESHQLGEQSLLRSAEHHPSARKPSPLLHARGSLSAAGPRDSRDSGIGLPCDTCSLEPGGEDGGFSPESFKQRLLRQQLMGA
ncbi:hypothetical protein MYCTH_108314 [Thermothelomyces thermophilus ATCC 42464]|uniref:C2H2-type domain-containing protein n=1 Tax=Thermothelomyces thermophilus (strain ATCC 42464 / BCRC 31852 / DSM 1799) TaxID=573729 RepID=G2QH40_THET4|nr:uncharacterized protein MYCTH_108314 [Thermothelomyces thermophilus ATCC 42464]AEO58700.1 hypothetical protein MYCTH_108314 [Thermothelomyces thermophilus ATCC 42464]